MDMREGSGRPSCPYPMPTKSTVDPSRDKALPTVFPNVPGADGKVPVGQPPQMSMGVVHVGPSPSRPLRTDPTHNFSVSVRTLVFTSTKCFSVSRATRRNLAISRS